MIKEIMNIECIIKFKISRIQLFIDKKQCSPNIISKKHPKILVAITIKEMTLSMINQVFALLLTHKQCSINTNKTIKEGAVVKKVEMKEESKVKLLKSRYFHP